MQISDKKILLNLLEVAKIYKVDVKDLTVRMYEEHGEFHSSTVIRKFNTWTSAKKKASKFKYEEIKSEVKRDDLERTRERKKDEVLSSYISFVKKNGAKPTIYDLSQIGISRDAITRTFGTMANLETAAREGSPDIFNDMYISSLFNDDTFAHLDDVISEYSRFVITTAVTGCSIHESSLASVKKYCEINNAALLVLVSSDPTHNMDKGDTSEPVGKRFGTIDKRLAQECIVLKDLAINNNLKIDTLKISAKMIDPSTGIARFGQRSGSLIIASPKQRQKVVPVSNYKLPHIIMTTGAITIPDYTTGNYMSERLAKIAAYDHQLGAIIVEVEDEEVFHFRQIQFDKKGNFYDIAGNKAALYTPNGMIEASKSAALVLGDLHSGETDPQVMEAWNDLAQIIKPDYVVIHDGFNGMSINHHEEKDRIIKAKRSKNKELSLEKELDKFAEDLTALSALANKEVVVVKSNHDDFLDRYLKEGRYVNDPENHYISLKLAVVMLEGSDPLKYAVEEIIGLDESTKVRWLKRSEDFKIARIQLGAHGDKGPNGARGNLTSMEAAYGQSITGHSHTAEILRGAWSVGTSSYLKLSYNEDSPSSWTNTSCIVWPNGQRQLINVISGKYKLEE